MEVAGASPGLLFEIELDRPEPSLEDTLFHQDAVWLEALVNEELAVEDTFHETLLKAVSTFPGDVSSAPLRDVGVWLANLGYDVSIRSAVGGGEGAECFRRLRHRFLVVTARDGSRCFVEPDFPAHFALAHPSARLRALLQALPTTVTARPERFEALVDLAAAEMARSFRRDSRGARPLPPWRSLKGLRGKWFPERPVDEPVRPDPTAFAAPVPSEAVAEVRASLRRSDERLEALGLGVRADSSDSVATVDGASDSSDAECPRVAGFGAADKAAGSTPTSVLGSTRGQGAAFAAAVAAHAASSGRQRATARAAWSALVPEAPAAAAKAVDAAEAPRRVSLLARAMVPLRGVEEPCVRTVRLRGAARA